MLSKRHKLFLELFLEDYFIWLQENSSVKKLKNGWFELSTPYFLDKHNDYIVVYAKQEKGIITISDDGETLFENEKNNPYFKKALEKILTIQGVKLCDKTLTVECNEGDFVYKLRNLISAIIEINALSYATTN
jgi:hypothetical protein